MRAVFGARFYSRTKGAVEFLRRMVLHRVRDVRIKVKRRRDGAVAKAFLRDFRMYALGQ